MCPVIKTKQMWNYLFVLFLKTFCRINFPPYWKLLHSVVSKNHHHYKHGVCICWKFVKCGSASFKLKYFVVSNFCFQCFALHKKHDIIIQDRLVIIYHRNSESNLIESYINKNICKWIGIDITFEKNYMVVNERFLIKVSPDTNDRSNFPLKTNKKTNFCSVAIRWITRNII